MITRRGMFGILAGAVAAPIVVRSGLLMPVKALAVPEFVVITSVSGHPGFLNPAIITRETLRILHEKTRFMTRISAAHSFNVGDTVTFKMAPYVGPAKRSAGSPE
jgi:hypothetical protein